MTTITLPRAVVEQALEALEDAKALLNSKDSTTTMWFADEITALRAALAEPVQEPYSPERRCGGPGCDMKCCQPVQEPAPMPPFPPVSLWKRGCAVCGIGAGGHAYGYACPRSDCPTRVTCGGTV